MLLFLFLLATLSLIFLLFPKSKKHEPFNPPAGPRGLPFIGNLLQFDPSSAPHLYLSQLAKSYGPIFSLQLGRKRTVVIQSAKIAKEVLKTQDMNFCGRPQMVGQQKLSYNGLDLAFVPYNEYYREMRKICVVHLFSSKRVQSFSLIHHDEVSRMINKVSSLSSASKIVNVSDLVRKFTNSTICRIAFGKRYDSEVTESSRFHIILNELEAMLVSSFCGDYLPYGGWLDKLMGQSCRLEKVFKDFDKFYEQVINEHLDPNRPKPEREDIIDVLLQLHKGRCFSFQLTLDHIKAVLMNILAAGTDTSAVMVVWAMTELIKNPKVMKKAQDELRTVNQGKTFINNDDIQNLEYFKLVVKETFRLHPAVPLLIARETVEKCTIEGYDILPKTLVYVNAWAIGRDPKSWDDPEMFKPERFMGSSIDYKGQDFELIPFGAGRRICPGMLLGVANFELALANLLYSFDWELPDGMKKEDIDTDVIPGIAVHKKNPLCLVAREFV